MKTDNTAADLLRDLASEMEDKDKRLRDVTNALRMVVSAVHGLDLMDGQPIIRKIEAAMEAANLGANVLGGAPFPDMAKVG
jgi:hypothetical protein